jgi:hypothetical protein
MRIHNNKIPANKFRATVRVSKSGSKSVVSYSGSKAKCSRFEADESEDWTNYFDQDTPNSFPSTPTSRAKYMAYSEVEADSVVFVVRDKLRLETQSECSDALSRDAASRLREAGKNNVAFDPTFILPGTYLACGNHYALKTGSQICSTSRGSLPIWRGVHVYVEFSLTAQSADNPTALATGPIEVSIGLVPPDCPPNVIVGKWPSSLGVSSNGTVHVSGQDFFCGVDETRPPFEIVVQPSTTVGMLIYLPRRCGDYTSNNEPLPLDAVLEEDSAGKGCDEIASEPDSTSTSRFNYYNAANFDHEKQEKCLLPEEDEVRSFFIVFNVNGKVVDMNESTKAAMAGAWGEDVEDLYPAISLLTKNSGTWCRFCESDVKYRQRSNIGAPPGVKVYCLDGSVLLFG